MVYRGPRRVCGEGWGVESGEHLVKRTGFGALLTWVQAGSTTCQLSLSFLMGKMRVVIAPLSGSHCEGLTWLIA